MGAGTLPAPGKRVKVGGKVTEIGPCVKPCAHRDCEATRAEAATPCLRCKEPIGFERAFYNVAEAGQSPRLSHAVCEEVLANAEGDPRRPEIAVPGDPSSGSIVHGDRGCFLVTFEDVEGKPRAWAHGPEVNATIQVARSHAEQYLQGVGPAPLHSARVRQFATCPNLGLADEPIKVQAFGLGPGLELRSPSR